MSIFGKKNNPKENENNAAEEAKATPAAEEKEEPTAAPIPDATMTSVNPEKPRYHTPEGFDFNRYFLAERSIVLYNVS